MSLSRPVTFPLLKLPWLCIKRVLHNSHLFAVIYFSTISRRTRRIVKSSNHPLKKIDLHLKHRCMNLVLTDEKMEDMRNWSFEHCTDEDDTRVPLVLQRNSLLFITSEHPWGGLKLCSYTAGDTLDALKMGLDFIIDVFGCTIRCLFVHGGNKLLELFGLGISSVKALIIDEAIDKPVNITDLKYLLENIKVTDKYEFRANIPKDFSCDPQIFQCRALFFSRDHSADWVTLDVLYQFDVPRIIFLFYTFSKEDIVSYFTYWFNSENRKLEYLYLSLDDPIALEEFKIDHLNPMPFCDKRRSGSIFGEAFKNMDVSSGMDILRKDGLLATFSVNHESILFYIWHTRFPDGVQS